MTGHGASDRPDGPHAWTALTPALERSGLSMADLYVRYVGLGGSDTRRALTDHLRSGGPMSIAEHDLAVLALNERFIEMNIADRLPYER